MCTVFAGSVPMTPDPNNSARVSRYKWEPYRDTNWQCIYTTFCQKKGILLQKYRDGNGRRIAIPFKSIGVRGRFDSPEKLCCHVVPPRKTANGISYMYMVKRSALRTFVPVLPGGAKNLE